MNQMTLIAVRDGVARFYGVTAHEVLANGGGKALREARYVGIYLAREHTGLSLEAIGLRFGRSGHSSAISAIDKVKRRLKREPEFAARVNELGRQLLASRIDPTDDVIAAFEPVRPSALRNAVARLVAADDALAVAPSGDPHRCALAHRERALADVRSVFEKRDNDIGDDGHES